MGELKNILTESQIIVYLTIENFIGNFRKEEAQIYGTCNRNRQGWKIKIYPVEIICRDFVGPSNIKVPERYLDQRTGSWYDYQWIIKGKRILKKLVTRSGEGNPNCHIKKKEKRWRREGENVFSYITREKEKGKKKKKEENEKRGKRKVRWIFHV